MFKSLSLLFLLFILGFNNAFASCATYTGISSDTTTQQVRNAVVESYETGTNKLIFNLSSAEYPYLTPLTCKQLMYSMSYNGATSIDENLRNNLIKAAILSQTLGYKLNFTVGANGSSPVLYSRSNVTVTKP